MDSILNTVFDDTIPQTPLNPVSNMNSASKMNYALDKDDIEIFEDNTEKETLKISSMPLKFEQVIIDDLKDEDLNNYKPPDNKETTETMSSACEVTIKKETMDDELDQEIKDECDGKISTRSKRDTFECSVCSKQYRNLKSFEKHEKQHNNDIEKSVKKKANEEHFEEILKSPLSDEIIQCLTPNDGLYTCSCKNKFSMRSALLDCLKSHHTDEKGKLNVKVKNLLKLCGKPTNDGLLKCKKCDFTCEKTEIMIDHRMKHKCIKNAFKCDKCDFTSNKSNSLNKHKLLHKSVNELGCDNCSFTCNKLCDMRKHQLLHAFKCDHCSFTCRLRGTLKKHAREQHDVRKLFPCSQCSYTGTRSTHLRRHILVHQQEKPFECTECDYKCKLINKLKTHMLIHSKSKNRKCNECGYVALNLGALKIHKRSHVKRGIFTCDLCPYATPMYEYFEAHKNIHRGKRAYPCLECSYVSTHSSSFRRHLFTHSGEKPFPCPECDFRACQENSLKIHMRTHSGERPYKCDECDYASSTVGTLKRHKLIHSPIVW